MQRARSEIVCVSLCVEAGVVVCVRVVVRMIMLGHFLGVCEPARTLASSYDRACV